MLPNLVLVTWERDFFLRLCRMVGVVTGAVFGIIAPIRIKLSGGMMNGRHGYPVETSSGFL